MVSEMFKSKTHNSPTFIENPFIVSHTSYYLRGSKNVIQPSI